MKHLCTSYPERRQPRLKTNLASTTQLLNVISHRCALGAIKKKFSNSMLSGVVLGLATAGNAVETDEFLRTAFDSAVAGIADPGQVPRTAA